jgi:hypothetical protein
MKLADKTQICYVVTREKQDGTEVIPCAVFAGEQLNDAQDTADAYNQKFKDEGIEGYIFKVYCTALYD